MSSSSTTHRHSSSPREEIRGGKPRVRNVAAKVPASLLPRVPSVDFLPAGYLTARQKRQGRFGLIAFTLVFLVAIGTVGVWQAHRTDSLTDSLNGSHHVLNRHQELVAAIERAEERLRLLMVKAQLREAWTISPVPVEAIQRIVAAAPEAIVIERILRESPADSARRSEPSGAASAAIAPSASGVPTDPTVSVGPAPSARWELWPRQTFPVMLPPGHSSATRPHLPGDNAAVAGENLATVAKTDALVPRREKAYGQIQLDHQRLIRELTAEPLVLRLAVRALSPMEAAEWLRTLQHVPGVEQVELVRMEATADEQAYRHRCHLRVTFPRLTWDLAPIGPPAVRATTLPRSSTTNDQAAAARGGFAPTPLLPIVPSLHREQGPARLRLDPAAEVPVSRISGSAMAIPMRRMQMVTLPRATGGG